MAEVMPDLSVGKAMANDFRSPCCGHRDIMDAARKTWISSTLASEGAALAAANANVTWHDTADVRITWRDRREMRNAVTSAVEAAGVEGLTIGGLDQMWTLGGFAGSRAAVPRARRGEWRAVQARSVQLCGARSRRRRDSRHRGWRERRAGRAARRGRQPVTVVRDASAIDTEPLIDAHAHFYHAESGRGDWADVNAALSRGRTYRDHVPPRRCSARTDSHRPHIFRRRSTSRAETT